jgi:hypothetical protein
MKVISKALKLSRKLQLNAVNTRLTSVLESLINDN